MYSPAQISFACQVPLAAAEANWPLLVAGMQEFGVCTPGTAIAIAANVAEETAHTFRSIEEYGDRAYWTRELGDQWEWHGRGFNQETWAEGYAWAAQATGIDCFNHPELLLDAHHSARVTAAFVKMKGIPAVAEARNWVEVRRLWNGGSNGLDVVLAHVHALLSLPYPPDSAPPLAGRVYTVVTQSILRTTPRTNGKHAINPAHQPVVLQPGTLVTATGAETPHWRKIQIPNGPVWGWLQKAAMR